MAGRMDCELSFHPEVIQERLRQLWLDWTVPPRTVFTSEEIEGVMSTLRELPQMEVERDSTKLAAGKNSSIAPAFNCHLFQTGKNGWW